MQKISLYFDESGDLGVNKGRFFLIGAIEIDSKHDKEMNRRAGRIINRFKNSYNISKNIEIKGCLLKRNQRIELLNKIIYKGVLIRYIVLDIKKTTFLLEKADDKNACYNYLIGLIIKDVIKDYPNIEEIDLYLDNRSVKIGNRLSLKPYLYNKLVLEQLEFTIFCKRIQFNVKYLESESCYLIQWVDIISNSIYKLYSRKINEYYHIIKPFIVFESRFPKGSFGQ
jgi:hypothetical protein